MEEEKEQKILQIREERVERKTVGKNSGRN